MMCTEALLLTPVDANIRSPIRLVPKHIVCYYAWQSAGDYSGPRTRIALANGGILDVCETPEEIDSRLCLEVIGEEGDA